MDHITKSGLLRKRGLINKSWKERWFVLETGELRYHEPANAGEYGISHGPLKGACPTQYITSVTKTPEDFGNKNDKKQTFRFQVHLEAKRNNRTDKREFYFSAPSEESREAWIEAISSWIGSEHPQAQTRTQLHDEAMDGVALHGVPSKKVVSTYLRSRNSTSASASSTPSSRKSTLMLQMDSRQSRKAVSVDKVGRTDSRAVERKDKSVRTLSAPKPKTSGVGVNVDVAPPALRMPARGGRGGSTEGAVRSRRRMRKRTLPRSSGGNERVAAIEQFTRESQEFEKRQSFANLIKQRSRKGTVRSKSSVN